MKVKCKNPKVAFDLNNNMTLSVDIEREDQKSVRQLFDDIKDKLLSLELKIFRPKRSNDANAYLWVLCGKLAEKLGITKEEVYRREVKNVGVYDVLTMSPVVYQSFYRKWVERGTGWFCEVIDEDYTGKLMIAVYYGSSSYDSAEMTRLINGVVEEAKNQGIQTETPNEIELMLSRWKDAPKA